MSLTSEYSQFSFGAGIFDDVITRSKRGVNTDRLSATERRNRKIDRFLAPYKRENELFRKPCPKCNNLVKPELLAQHYEAYHPNDVIPSK